MEEITHQATCAFCERELVGWMRKDGSERMAWVHTVRADELQGGLHTAYPKLDSAVEIKS